MKHSLKRKTLILIILVAAALSGFSVIGGNKLVTDMINDDYMSRAAELAETTATVLNKDETEFFKNIAVDYYKSTGTDEKERAEKKLDNTKDYINLEKELRSIRDINEADSIHLIWVDSRTGAVVTLADVSDSDIVSPGAEMKEHRVSQKDVRENPEKLFLPKISNNKKNGHFATAGSPIHDRRGMIIAYAIADISLDDVLATKQARLFGLIAIIFVLTILICAAAIIHVKRTIITPINQLSRAAEEYAAEEDDSCHTSFSKVQINTKDEIEFLANSMKKMEIEINEKNASQEKMTNELSETKIQAERMGRMARVDHLTGIRNKFGYSEEITSLQDEIKSGTAAFGIAVIDLDDLKKINDTYGHSKGDLAIRRLSCVTCTVFSHSPVFRIGGDEFVVVLKNSDYDNANSLIREFSSSLTSNSSADTDDPWEMISASIGYSMFDPDTDSSVDDVFRRADQAMYEWKKSTKKGRLS